MRRVFTTVAGLGLDRTFSVAVEKPTTVQPWLPLSVVAPSFQLNDLVSTLGIGLAAGFAFRDVFQSFLAGVILLLVTQPFHIGDRIKAKAYESTVDEIETMRLKR